MDRSRLGMMAATISAGLASIGNSYAHLPYESNTTRRPGKRYPFSSTRQIERNQRQFAAGQIKFGR